MKKLFLLLTYFSASAYMVSAQNALPDTDIFICDIELKNGKYSFTNLKNITNREGYDNQPSFIDNNTILYTSIREDKQADIYKIDLATGKITQVTKTPEDEYSPTLMPDGKHISTVRVEKDSAQRLWKFPLANPSEFSLVLPDIKGVGYHLWINDDILGLFMLGDKFTLQVADSKSQEIEIVDSVIGRSLQKTNIVDELAYVSKKDSLHWLIKTYNYQNSIDNQMKKIIELPKGSEDFVFGADSAYWASSGTKLFRYSPGVDKQWKEIFNFKGTAAENFYRIAFSPDGKKLALVSYVGKKP